MRYWSESQFSSDFLLFLIINMQSSLHASLWKHRNLTRLRYSIIHFLMQNGVNAWINYVSTRDCWFYVPVGRCWSSGTPINTLSQWEPSCPIIACVLRSRCIGTITAGSVRVRVFPDCFCDSLVVAYYSL